jgi:LysR family transcriptional activator of nhaA
LTLAVVQAAYAIGDCMVTVLEGKGEELVRELALHRIDLFISNYLPATHEARGLYSKSIAKLPVSLCGAPKYKSLKSAFPTSLARAPMILPTAHSKLRDDLEHYFKNAEIALDVIAETQDTVLQKLMAVEGIGIIPIPTFAVEDPVKDGQLIVLGQLPGVFEEFYLVAASRKIENPISSQLMKSFHL